MAVGIKMKLLICGSRTFRDLKLMEKHLEEFATLDNVHDITIIHGDAKGADKAADRIAKKYGWKVERYPADWEAYGKAAGIIRNDLMLDLKPDLVMAFWDGKSRGTKHTIEEAKKRGIKTQVVHF